MGGWEEIKTIKDKNDGWDEIKTLETSQKTRAPLIREDSRPDSRDIQDGSDRRHGDFVRRGGQRPYPKRTKGYTRRKSFKRKTHIQRQMPASLSPPSPHLQPERKEMQIRPERILGEPNVIEPMGKGEIVSTELTLKPSSPPERQSTELMLKSSSPPGFKDRQSLESFDFKGAQKKKKKNIFIRPPKPTSPKQNNVISPPPRTPARQSSGQKATANPSPQVVLSKPPPVKKNSEPLHLGSAKTNVGVQLHIPHEYESQIRNYYKVLTRAKKELSDQEKSLDDILKRARAQFEIETQKCRSEIVFAEAKIQELQEKMKNEMISKLTTNFESWKQF